MAKQIQIASGPEWVSDPGHEEHGAFEYEAVAMRRDAQPVEQTLKRIARQENLEIRLFGAGSVEEPRPDRCADVARLTRHRTPLLRRKGA